MDSFLGIRGYRPSFQDDVAEFRALHGQRLRALVGHRITNAWGMWSRVRGEWFPDGPVVLAFDNEARLELVASNLAFGASWGKIDLDEPLCWYVSEGETDDGIGLYWRPAAPAPMCDAIGKRVELVELTEFHQGLIGAERWTFIGIGVRLDGGYLDVYNALDELGLASVRTEGPTVRRSEL